MTEKQLEKLTKKLTRLEVIDETGRAYVVHGAKIEIQIQDEERTIKIFVNKNKSK